MKKIATRITLILVSIVSVTAAAQGLDDSYMTPSQARKIRAQREKEYNEYRKKIEERSEREQALRKKKALQEEAFQDSLTDWYNRRSMRVTINQMEDNLDRLDGQRSARRGGEYSKRIRRFHDNGNIVISNVDKVYVLDDMYYDPWSDSYYGYDSSSNVNIYVNYGTHYPHHRWGGYHGYAPYHSSWYYPWYDRWYSTWYDPWYSPWYGPRWGYTGYYGYYGPGWGYYDYWGGWYGGPTVVNNYYYTPRTYSQHGRAATGYSRAVTQRNDNYGRALGRSAQRIDSWSHSSETRSSHSRYDYRRETTRPRSSNWDSGFGRSTTGTSTRSNSGSYSTGSGSSTRSSGSGASGGTAGSRRR